MRLLPSIAVVLALVAGPASTAIAQTHDEIIASVPLDVPEVVSGGEWRHDGAMGAYRALVLLVPSGDALQALVYVQWIGAKDTSSPLDIIASLAIKDVSVRTLPTASIAIEAETPNEATIIVSSIDLKTQKPVVLAYKATRPGVIAPTEVPDDYKPQESAPAVKQ